MKGIFIVIFIGSFVLTGSSSLEDYSRQIAVYGPESSSYSLDGLGLEDQLVEKRGGGKWRMRMFKRDPGGSDSDEGQEIPDEYEDEGMDMSKRGQPWKMRMFKKKDPWKMRMFKRLPYMMQSELDKKSPWKMRMFKRLAIERTFGKRPDKWQMRMFKRDPEIGQEMPGDSLR